MDYSSPNSSVHGILQARKLEWVAILFSRGSFWPRDQTWVSFCFVAGTLPFEPPMEVGYNWMGAWYRSVQRKYSIEFLVSRKCMKLKAGGGRGALKETWTNKSWCSRRPVSCYCSWRAYEAYFFPFALMYSDSKCLNIMWKVKIEECLNFQSALHLSV